jgi:acetyl-CoA carboxylase biotin carboxylase subunit
VVLRRILIANRGEIAVRIARTCRAMGIETVAVHSTIDRGALHVQVADHAVAIGPAPPRQSYLDAGALVAAAHATGADAIHPGYGFLSENAAFARRVRDAGLVFIGPSSEAIAAMGDKLVSRRHATEAGVPVVPGAEFATAAGPGPGDILDAARAVGLPVLIKATAGGGGKGMRIVRDQTDLLAAVAAGTREAESAFGDGRLYLERYLERPRHIEIQILADAHGAVVHLGERECSIQRRHQKIVEETPAPHLDPALRERIAEAAVRVARAVGYTNAGTVEFLLDRDGSFYFLEMNTRLQVEHPVTEWVTGIDLVAEQIRIAGGERLGYAQADIQPRGAAIECRVYAEDAANGFLPSAGPVLALREPVGPGVRVDSGIGTGSVVPVEYDPLLAKLSTWALARDLAIDRMVQALRDTAVIGPTTNVEFLGAVIGSPPFRRGDTHTDFIPEHFPSWTPDGSTRTIAALLAAVSLAERRRSSQASGTGVAGEATLPSPWTSLGPWRLGGPA